MSGWVVEKIDRLYRNRTDALAVEELIEKRGLEVHLVKEARPRIDPSLRKA